MDFARFFPKNRILRKKFTNLHEGAQKTAQRHRQLSCHGSMNWLKQLKSELNEAT
jgi:hypothetical protein